MTRTEQLVTFITSDPAVNFINKASEIMMIVTVFLLGMLTGHMFF